MSSFFCYSVRDQSVYIPSLNGPTVLLPRNHLDCHVAHGLFEEDLIEWSKQFCSSEGCFVDIGAHTGTYTASLATCSGEVVAFEPQCRTFYALCGTVALSSLHNVHCHNIALGSRIQEGSMKLSIPSIDGGGSSLLPNNSECEYETVEVRTLDSYDLRNVSFIKIDVEGNEPEVMEGAKQTLTKYKPIILFEDNSTVYDPTKYPVLEELGYTVLPVANCNNMFLAHI